MIIILALIISVKCALKKNLDADKNPEDKMDFMEICAYYSYPVEEHLVETDDGYILR